MKIVTASVGRRFSSGVWLVALTFTLAAWLAPHSAAFQVRERDRFDALVIEDPSERAPMQAQRLDKLVSAEDATGVAQDLRDGWQSFFASHGARWDVHLDRRSGAPMLVQGPGIPIQAVSSTSSASSMPALDSLEASLRAFLADHESILRAHDDELVLDRAASGETAPGSWQVVFDHVVNGVPVQGERYIFHLGHGNLIAFGATRWTPAAVLATLAAPPTSRDGPMASLVTSASAIPRAAAVTATGSAAALAPAPAKPAEMNEVRAPASDVGALVGEVDAKTSQAGAAAHEAVAGADDAAADDAAVTAGARDPATTVPAGRAGSVLPRLAAAASPSLTPAEALARLYLYMGIGASDGVEVLDRGTLTFVSLPARGSEDTAYAGPPGSGYRPVLAWRLALRVPGEPGRWVGLVDARDGAVLAFHDDDRYARVKGGVYPLSNDQACPDGCEQSGYPMPFADIGSGAATQSASATGFFDCEPPGAGVTTMLSGPYVRVVDTCGILKESSLCGSDLDLRSGAMATDCAVPAGATSGDTHASRTGFYQLNRIIERARGWLPGNAWLTLPLTDRVNITSSCNAFWNGGSVNFYRSGNGCRNTGEIASILAHEWGHGLDENDGGGFDNPSEAYADITAFLHTHSSCIGRGLFEVGNCGGYGDPCLSCTGARDVDWDKRRDHLPSTPSGFLSMRCDPGGGPCGKEVHCESYVATEALWDLAARDLPSSGVDTATSWQIVERLWYRSRLGSGGSAYNCALPSSDGCGAGSWFTKLRAVDDEDGDLANGTPHAAAIFAAFDRHRIACGAAADSTNQSSSTCPVLAAPLLEGAPGAESASLSWTPVTGAAAYTVLRSDTGCAAAFTAIATVPGTSFTDTRIANGFPVSYAVKAVGSGEACEGALSACTQVTPQPFAGSVAIDRAVYRCTAPIRIEVRDGNTGSPTVTVRIASTSEPSALVVKLAREGTSEIYTGTIQATPDPPSDDGRLSLRDGDTIQVEYVDADDGNGNTSVSRRATATADCRPPLITEVSAGGITGQRATISWRTDEPATSVVHYGPGAPGPAAVSAPSPVTLHAVQLVDLAECAAYAFTVESTDTAGNTAVDDGGGSAYPLATPKSTEPAFSSTGTPLPIPDADPAGATSTITVEDQRTVLDVNVRVEIQHTFASDLVVSLITPTGAAIELSDRRGYPGRSFTGTLFDDESPLSVAAGNAPFTGSFRPDRPLNAADGIGAAGEWKLLVVDTDPIATGRIESWTLELTFAESPCGPHASYSALLPVEDVCAAGGPGSRNGAWDGGERARFDVKIVNDGSIPLTGVRAAIVPLTPGLTMTEPVAEYGALAPNSVGGGSAGGVFEAQLPLDPVCGSPLEFRLDITSDQGSWSDLFGQVAGRPLTSTLTVLTAAFGSGIPSGWTVVNGGTGGGSAATWTTANPGARSFPPPMALPVAIVDSDRAGSSAVLDEQLITPVRNLTPASTVRLEFDQSFVWFFGQFDEKGDVDVRSSRTGGAWYNVLRNRGASSASADHRDIDVTAQAAGASDFQVRFHYYDAVFEYWWAIDNVRLSYTRPAGCAILTCGPSIAPPPVPDGTFGDAMKAARPAPDGTAIDVTWDAATCPAPGYHILFGGLSRVAEYSIGGAVCAIGDSGAYQWTGVPSGSLWFLVVADNGEALEGTWGRNSAGVDRMGNESSRLCGLSVRDNAGVCE